MTITETPSDTITVTFTVTLTPEDTLTPTVSPTACAAGILGNDQGSLTQFSGGSTLYASRFELIQSVSLTEIYVYVESGNGSIMAAIYTNSGSEPGQPELLVYPVIPSECEPGWNTLSIPVVPLPAGIYWLAIQAQAGIQLRYSSAPEFSGIAVSNTFGSFPDPVGVVSYQSRAWSVYASYCADIGYIVTATVTPTITMTSTETPYYTPTMTVTPTPVGPPAPEENDTYAYPVPATDTIHFVFNLAGDADVTIQIYDFAGNRIRTVEISENAGFRTRTEDVSKFSAGIYYYTLQAKGASGDIKKYRLSKFIIKK